MNFIIKILIPILKVDADFGSYHAGSAVWGFAGNLEGKMAAVSSTCGKGWRPRETVKNINF